MYSTEKYAIFKIDIPASENETALRASTIKVEYTDAVTGEEIKLMSHLYIEYTADENYASKQRNVEIAAQAESARNAVILDETVKLADSGKDAEASALLQERAASLSGSEYESDSNIQNDITYFNSVAADISKEGSMSNENRKQSVNKSYSSRTQQR